jgi:uncharacterized protein
MKPFFQYVLRTTDVPAARAFYEAILGRDDAEIVELHEGALARGARPHWLGCIDVADVDAAAREFQARGATPLGPKWVRPDGVAGVVLRDPGGAIVAVAKSAAAAANSCAGVSRPEVVWHHLNTTAVERAKLNYGELFGWEFTAPRDLGDLGVLHTFAWRAGEAVVGAMSDIASRPHVHPHWLFHFRVADLDLAVERARGRGGVVLGPLALPSAERVAICDDPQGAAFALLEQRT